MSTPPHALPRDHVERIPKSCRSKFYRVLSWQGHVLADFALKSQAEEYADVDPPGTLYRSRYVVPMTILNP